MEAAGDDGQIEERLGGKEGENRDEDLPGVRKDNIGRDYLLTSLGRS